MVWVLDLDGRRGELSLSLVVAAWSDLLTSWSIITTGDPPNPMPSLPIPEGCRTVTKFVSPPTSHDPRSGLSLTYASLLHHLRTKFLNSRAMHRVYLVVIVTMIVFL